MSLPTSIRSALLANTALNAITGDRVYYMRFPQDSTDPALVFLPMENVRHATLGGTSVLLEPEVRLTIRARSLSDLEAMREAVIGQWNVPEVSLTNYGAVQCRINDLGSEYDKDLDVYHHYITLNLQMRIN